ncbi:MAG: trigger factor [Treponema sp.]|nr:trigger factor [Treponema sp.]
MTINKEISRQEHSSVKLTLTVAKDDVCSQYEEVLKNYGKNIQIPGFRRGKIPRDVLVRKLGDSLKAETLANLIEKSAEEFFENKDLPRNERPLPYSTPKVQDEPALDLEHDLSYSMIYDVLPDVQIGAWKGLEAEAPEAELSDDDINRELEAVRERNAVVLDRDDDAGAEKDNVVTVDYCEIGDDGEIVPKSERQDFVFTLGKGYNIYKFDDDILGMKKNETRELVKTYPPEETDTELAGRTVKIRVTLTALKERRLPDLDDDLAQDVDEKYHNLEDLKNSIRESLGRNLKNRLREIRISKILEQIVANTPVDIPLSMIRIEIESRWRSLGRRLDTTGEQLKKSMENNGQSLENIENEWRPAAVKAIHSRLIVETLMEELKLEAGDDDMEKELADIAADENSTVEEIKKYYGQEHMLEYLRENIKERKLFDILLAENTIKPGKRENYLDLMSNNG